MLQHFIYLHLKIYRSKQQWKITKVFDNHFAFIFYQNYQGKPSSYVFS